MRKSAIDKAIENVNEKIEQHRADIQALELARAHLVEQQTAAHPPTLKSVTK